ncbi:peptidylprolyl isomerase [Meiothermus cerbereus]|uniref:peptidylprolyl isomerase n=1 Tax=Meiothermus cerbereus TaxID=65552 RepID=UPI003EE83CE3
MQIELSEKEVKALLELLKEHINYGWIEQEGEFEVLASGRVSATLKELLRRLKAEARAKAA